MRRALRVLGLMLLAARALGLEGTASSLDPNQVAAGTEDKKGSGWYMGLGGGGDFSMGNWPSAYSFGNGMEGIVGYSIEPHLAVQLEVGNQVFQAVTLHVSTTLYDLRSVAELKLSTGDGRLKPYLLLGPGADLRFATGESGANSSFDALGGLGLEYGSKDFWFFLEGKYNLVFANTIPGSGPQEDMPVDFGVIFKL
jgi:hypothetical protein